MWTRKINFSRSRKRSPRRITFESRSKPRFQKMRRYASSYKRNYSSMRKKPFVKQLMTGAIVAVILWMFKDKLLPMLKNIFKPKNK